MLFAAKISVWARWFVCAFCLAELAHRPWLWYPDEQEYLLLVPPVLIFNGLIHYWLYRDGEVSARWLLFLSAMDIFLITTALIIAADFDIYTYIGYYPALAVFAVVFASPGISLVWTTLVAALYSFVSTALEPGLDIATGEEKALAARVGVMYVIVVSVSLVARFERHRLQSSADQVQRLLRERIEISQAIHDSAAQSAYMISVGIHRAMTLAGGSSRELTDTLAATSSMAKTATWELRRPIEDGRLFEGRQLGRVLWSHVETFSRITALPAEMQQYGTEPPLPLETRTRLFSFAHNALTNAFLHAKASKVEVELEFEGAYVRLSVSDDGIGLPHDYAERGHGISGMSADAERLGGRLIAETGEGGRGTTLICEVPAETRPAPDEGD